MTWSRSGYSTTVQQTRGPGTIFVGGPVHTMGDPATAEAVRVDGRRITAVGDLADLRSLGDAEIVDLGGRCLMPGFARRVDLRPEVIRRLFSAESPNPTLSTVVALAGALELELTAEPLEDSRTS